MTSLHPYYLSEASDASKPAFKAQGNVEVLPETVFRSKPTINILSHESTITFKVNSRMTLLSLHLNTLRHFVWIELLIEDNQHRTRKITLSNKKSKIVIYEKECTIPIKIGESWQYVYLNMADLMKRAFGSVFDRCKEVVVGGVCKLSSVYLHNEPIPDVSLPVHLQVFDHQ